jgi:hypothetical protein
MTHHHDHPTEPDVDSSVQTDGEIWEATLRDLLIAKGVITPSMMRQQMDQTASQSASIGAEIIVRAWTTPLFKDALLKNPKKALSEYGYDVVGMPDLCIVENQPDIHNVVVCTLCSCYPRFMLGPPPEWYKSAAFRSRLVQEPKDVLLEFGLDLNDAIKIRVYDSTADIRYMVMPMRPAGTAHMSADELKSLITRDTMIGVAFPELPVIGHS